MGKRQKHYIPVLIMCLAIVTCLVMTGLIVMKMIPTKADIKKGKYTLKNVYITDTSGGKIRFVSEGKALECPGKLSEPYSGIADVQISNRKITKVYSKPDYVNGVLLSYDGEQMDINGVGVVERNEEIPVYVRDGTSVGQTDFSELIVGSSRMDFVFENGRVCALVMEPQTKVTNIHVLIKNGSGIFYKNLYVKGSKKWSINGKNQKKGKCCNIGKFLDKEEGTICEIEGGKGMLFLCDKKGNEIGEGYEGTFTVQKKDEGLVLVNVLPVEDYVRYVLPSEMMPSFSYEALKAQAICARTFAYTQMKGSDYAEYGANLDNSTSYQVYHAAAVSDVTDQAVKDTKGQVLTYQDKMITCYYFSTSAGRTEDYEVWENSDSPDYLTPQSCLKKDDYGDLSKAKNFSKFIHAAPESYDSTSNFYRWTAQVDLSKIKDSQNGAIKSIEVSKRSKSGYVTGLTCVYEGGSKRVCNENKIRTLLGQGLKKLTLADGTVRDFSTIPSACFEVTKTEGSVVTLTGGGFGHGVGMSQYGADAMGKEGADCAQILEFYYKGTKIKKY